MARRQVIWHEVGYRSDDIGPVVALLGNGLNRASAGPSWEDLLEELYNFVRPDPTFRFDQGKPFPLLYEELYLHARRKAGTDERELLDLVAQHCKKIRPGRLHSNLSQLGIRHLLTTNYDDAATRAFLGDESKTTDSSPVTETRYSLFRRSQAGDRVVWNIHGTQMIPSTIMLGYEHYGGYLERLRRYIASSVRYQEESLRSLISRLQDGDDVVRSWVDFFFSKNVVILGLSLDFVEIHLWWLLTYRARIVANGVKKIRGKITYFCARNRDLDESLDRRRRLELLDATGVRVIQLPLKRDNWADYYERAMDEIRS